MTAIVSDRHAVGQELYCFIFSFFGVEVFKGIKSSGNHTSDMVNGIMTSPLIQSLLCFHWQFSNPIPETDDDDIRLAALFSFQRNGNLLVQLPHVGR